VTAALLYQRRCVVAVDTLLVDGLRVQFKVVKSLKKEPNSCELTISNLSKATRSTMRKTRAAIILSAGYADTVAQIFSGHARTTDHKRNGPTWETLIQAADGEVQFQANRVSESFGPGTKVADVIAKLAGASGLNPGNVLEAARAGGFRGNLDQFAQGYVAHGKAATELERIFKSAGLEWSVQDGALQVLKPGATSTTKAILLSPTTGLIGSPEHAAPDKKGKPSPLKCKALIQPQFKPGVRVAVQARDVQGEYRIVKVTHTGDTHGPAWYSELEVRPA
jgi:hypothetical protein